MAIYTEYCYVSYSDGSSAELPSLTEEIDALTIAVTDTLAYRTYGQTYVINQCTDARVTNLSNWFQYENIDLTAVQGNGNRMNFFFHERIQIPDFSWTDNDSEKIKPGQPVTNLTADAINNLYQKIEEAGNFMYLSSIPTIKSGDAITADAILPACSALREGARRVDENMLYAMMRSIISIKAGAPILASTLLTMKDTANRVFQEMRPL